MPVAGRSTAGSVSIIVEMLCVKRFELFVDAVVPGGDFHVAFHGQVTLFLVAADDVVKFFQHHVHYLFAYLAVVGIVF